MFGDCHVAEHHQFTRESSKIARSMGSSCSQPLELLTCQLFGRKAWPRSNTSHLIPIEPYLSICVLISSPLRKWDVLSRFPGLLSRLKDMNWFISMHGQHPSKVTFAFPSFFKCRGNGIPPFYLAGSPYLIADTPLAKTPGMKGRTSYFGRIGFIIRSWTFALDQSASDHCGWHRGAYRDRLPRMGPHQSGNILSDWELEQHKLSTQEIWGRHHSTLVLGLLALLIWTRPSDFLFPLCNFISCHHDGISWEENSRAGIVCHRFKSTGRSHSNHQSAWHHWSPVSME